LLIKSHGYLHLIQKTWKFPRRGIAFGIMFGGYIVTNI
jgi:hypothetical protein